MIEEFEPQAIPAEDEALRPRIRAFLDQHWRDVPAQVRAHSWSGFDPGFSRALGAAGFVGLTLPPAYGGAGRSAFARFVVVEELLARGAPLAAHWIADRQSGPMIARYGTERQRRELLPGICRGELYFCIGMSEPDSGSDLASIRTRATRVDGGWRLSGRKIWTTNAHRAHRMIALVRSAPQRESRHAGLSQFVVDLALPGVSVRPIADLTGAEYRDIRDAAYIKNDARRLDAAEQPVVKRRHQRRALAARGDIRGAKVADRCYAGALRDDVGIAYLQRVGARSVRLVPHGLPVTADGAYLGGLHAGQPQQLDCGVAKPLPDLAVERAEIRNGLIGRRHDGFAQRVAQRIGVGVAVRCEQFDGGVAETHERGIDAVHAGA